MTHHDHTHPHDHDHSHGHHDHGHSDSPMGLEEKLITLLSHWVDHNESHKDNFVAWADRAEEGNFSEVARHLKEAGALSHQVTEALKKARKALEG